MPKRAKSARRKILDLNSFNLATQQEPHPDLRSLTLRKMQTLDYLNGTNMPQKFKFRQTEIAKIEAFIEKCLSREQKGYRFIMVTGSPGAGKTLSINHVLGKVQCEVIRMNANIVKTINQVQQLICEKLLGDSKARTAPQILRELEEIHYQKTCVVYIEEIELLFKTPPSAISEDFLTLFLKKSANLVLLGISNTINTLQRYSSKYSFNIGEIENVVFEPYKAQHIMAILSDKLEHVKEKMKIGVVFSEKLLKFSAQKLQTLKKGDFRICIQFLKQTVRQLFQTTQQTQQQEPIYTVTIQLINRIFDRMQISKNDLISKLPYQLKLLLLALYNITISTQALFISTKQLTRQLKWIYTSMHMAFTPQMLDDRLKELEQYAMVKIRKKVGQETTVVLEVSTDEVRSSLEGNQLLEKYLVEEKK